MGVAETYEEMIMTKHAVGHVEFSATDLERSRAFYQGLFEWSFRSFGDEYLFFEGPGGLAGGLMKVKQVHPGQSSIVYIEVDELEPYLEKVGALGGSVVNDRTPVADMGSFAHIADPDGNVVGLWEGKKSE